jgi:hypothetical protein
MSAKVVFFPRCRSVERSAASPAQFYELNYGPAASIIDDEFLGKAAAFQEIRDCLAAADLHQLPVREAERRIRYFVRAYLGIGYPG